MNGCKCQRIPTAGYGSLGNTDTTAAAGGSSGSFLDAIVGLAPSVNAIVATFQDPARRAAVLEAKLRNARAAGAPASQIRLIEAKLEAARREMGLKDEAIESARDWSAIGKSVAWGVGLVAGSAALYLTVRAVREGRR